AQGGRGGGRLGLFHDTADAMRRLRAGFHADYSIASGLVPADVLDCEHRTTTPGKYRGHLLQGRGIAVDEIVREHDRKRIVAHYGFRAEHGVTESQRLRLAPVGAVHVLGNYPLNHLEQALVAALLEFMLQLESLVEMILDRAFSPARDEDLFVQARRNRLLDGVLNERLVHDRPHFLWTRFFSRKKERTHARD